MYDLKKTHLLINGGIISGDTGHALLAEATKGKAICHFHAAEEDHVSRLMGDERSA